MMQPSRALPGTLLLDGPALTALQADIADGRRPRRGGYVRSCHGQLVVARGLQQAVSVGDCCLIEPPCSRPLGSLFDFGSATPAEVVGFEDEDVLLVPYAETTGIRSGTRVAVAPALDAVAPSLAWRGRVLDPFASPLDGQPAPDRGSRAYKLRAAPLAAHQRSLVGGRLALGVRAMDLFTPCCEGQRLGIFAGSGVGKSTLLSMIARDSSADVIVVGLIGERGRELNEFLRHTLSPEARERCVLVVATSDMPAMMRRRAAYLTLTVAEALRDEGLQVLCLLDSVTRFAMALREIYLAAGEVPASKGYPPGVFAELPRLLERAGPGAGSGSITGLFAVLVEGDDNNEPIADAVRGILDGHVMLDRAIAEAGRFPAIDVLRSISRTAPGCYTPEERELVREARRLLRAHADLAELIRLGAYKRGSDPLTDRAIEVLPELELVLQQDAGEPAVPVEAFPRLAAALGRPWQGSHGP
jgi:flagellum-specific ATP synthase